MKVKFVFKILPVFIFYGSKVKGGKTKGMVIRINEKYINDRGLLEHELTHVKQFYKLPFINDFLYTLLKSWRYKCELEAYAEQLRWYLIETIDVKIIRFALMLSSNYHLNITAQQVAKDLRERYETNT